MNKTFLPLAFVLTLLLCLDTATPAQAQNGNGFFNGLFNGGQRARDRRAAEAAQRSAGREIQIALNYFGFDAGVVDGVLGSQSREAVNAYQAALDFPVTGRLTEDEKTFLLSAYERIENGDQEMDWQVLANAEGTLGILKSLYLEENPFASIDAQPVELDHPSMRAFCVNIAASSPIDLAKAQFCNLRQLSIDQAEFLAETAPNPQTLDQISEQCEAFASAMTLASTDLIDIDSVLAEQTLTEWVDASGLPRETLSRIAKTCLGAGYSNDSSIVAIASALALTGLGDAAYIELIGYHLAFGLGFEGVENYALAVDWFANADENLTEDNSSITGQQSDVRAEIINDIADILAANL